MIKVEPSKMSKTERFKQLSFEPLIKMPKSYCNGVPVVFAELPKDNKTIFNIVVGVNIRLFRETKGISREELAKELHLTPKNIEKIENFEREVTAYELFKIAKVLNVSIDDLTSIRLDHSLTKLSPFELAVCPMLQRSFETYFRKELFENEEIATTVLKRAVTRLIEFPELYVILAKLNPKRLKKVIDAVYYRIEK